MRESAQRWANRLGKKWEPMRGLPNKPFIWPEWLSGPMLRTAQRYSMMRIESKKAGLYFLQLTPLGRLIRDHMNTMYVNRKSLRKAIVALQGNRCIRCGQPFARWRSGQHHQPNAPTLDHVISRDAGGWDGPGNFIALHVRCNHAKGNGLATGCELIWAMAIGVNLGHLKLIEGYSK